MLLVLTQTNQTCHILLVLQRHQEPLTQLKHIVLLTQQSKKDVNFNLVNILNHLLRGSDQEYKSHYQVLILGNKMYLQQNFHIHWFQIKTDSK